MHLLFAESVLCPGSSSPTANCCHGCVVKTVDCRMDNTAFSFSSDLLLVAVVKVGFKRCWSHTLIPVFPQRSSKFTYRNSAMVKIEVVEHCYFDQALICLTAVREIAGLNPTDSRLCSFVQTLSISTVVAQDHRRPCLPRCRCKSLEHASAGDHITTVTGGFQARTEDGTVP